MTRLFSLVLLAAIALTPLAMVWSLLAVTTWRGPWRWWGAGPLLALGAYVAIVLIPAWIRDPTSHNLFPLELAINLSPSGPYMLVVVLMRARRIRAEPAERLKCPSCGELSVRGPGTCGRCGASLRHAAVVLL